MGSVLRVIYSALKAEIAGLMAYRADFFLSVVLIFIGELIFPMITLLIYSSGASFPGWDLHQVLLLQGIFLLSKGVVDLLFSGVIFNTLERVREGTFDLLLIKPRGTLFMAMVTGINLRSVGSLLSGLLVFSYAVVRNTEILPAHIPMFLFMFLLSLSVLFSFTIISAAVVFKWVGNSRIFELFSSVNQFALYPRGIFSRTTQSIISYIIPISTISFYPASVLLGKSAEGIVPGALTAVLFLGFSLGLWKIMLKNYTSAGG